MMKNAARLFAATSVITVAALAMTGCAAGGSGASGGSSDKLTIAFIPGIASDPFFKAMEVGARKAAKDLGVTLIWQGSASDYSPATQIPFVDSALAQNVDALILVPTDPDSLQASVTKAEAQKIPVITVDTTVTDQSYLTSHITGDNVDGGKQAAITLAKQIGDKGKVFIQSGSPSATTNTLREKGFRDEMKKHPDITIIGREYSNSQPAAATSAINTILLKEPNLAGIFAIDGTSGTGAIAALQNSGKAGTVKLIGYDAYKAQVEALQSGVFSALVAQRPGDEAKLALEYAVKVIKGKKSGIKKSVVIPNVIMTKDNFATTGKFEYVD
jgi:ribose transport system substrate-binding protein